MLLPQTACLELQFLSILNLDLGFAFGSPGHLEPLWREYSGATLPCWPNWLGSLAGGWIWGTMLSRAAFPFPQLSARTEAKKNLNAQQLGRKYLKLSHSGLNTGREACVLSNFHVWFFFGNVCMHSRLKPLQYDETRCL